MDGAMKTIDGLDTRERLTLADAIDAYRSVRSEDKKWMRLEFGERLSPHQLDKLRDALLEGTGGGKP